MLKLRGLFAGIRPHKVLRSRPAKFVAIGIVNTAFGYLVYSSLYLATSDHRLSIVVATIIGVIFNFFTTGRVVFQNTNSARIFRFVAGYAIYLTANMVLLELLVRMGINALFAQLICLPPIALLTYFINARVVFRTIAHPDQST
jgi:putative flippase GtrA